MRTLTLFACLLMTGCGDEIIFPPPTPTPQPCNAGLPGLFKATCIIKDATQQYVLINEHPEIPDNLLELPGDIVGIDETPEAAAARGVKTKTGLTPLQLCFVFNTAITNVFDCGKVDEVAQSDTFTIEHRPSLDNVNWK